MISLAAGTVRDAGPAQVLQAASTAGYDAAGLRLDPASVSLAEAARLRRRADDSGLTVLDVEVVRLRPDSHLDDQRRLLDLAGMLGARFLLTVSEHRDEGATAADLTRLHEAARGHSTRIALEFMRFTGVPTLAAALALLDGNGLADAVVVVDALHLHRAGEPPEDLAAVPAERIGYVQLCDAPAHPPRGLDALSWEARHDRLAPGEGELPLGRLLAQVGPAVPLSVEVQSDRLTARSAPVARAGRLLADTRRVLASAAGPGRSTV
ncbi:sugar phosphate isomerase/epimerase family protein [Nonomuraea cavernae]|uniref:Xylose isomerase n=1 Tax=Nonomuraea cavernae TaxID=2045107 RepID=A0A918DRD0_9ACTN|nr:sugar phosphate isomerase/epimerase [Nonomuraea cavernae]MCA2189766.1 sugar phosphate isomerase/epimerase [Nonomuraea cavernae]GGO79918.1 xylose isomerase [Nonomuraea cavernae]